ncbi:MAG TPA: HAD-IA family hydrolase [Clostridiales bacterium]|nr:HAD-IA family hydrolase [Clostridiales bacterium]
MAITKKYKAVIFDLDDTLYPEKDYIISGFKTVSQYIENKTNLDFEEIFATLLELFDKDRKRVFNRLLEVYDIYEVSLLQKSIELYREHYPDISLPLETLEILNWLKDNGFKIGIITDGRPEGQWNKIKALGLQEYCDAIIITDELGGVEFRKPNAKGYEKMLKILNIKSEEALYVGDNIAKDFVTANRLGITTVMYKNEIGLYSSSINDKSYMPKYIISSLNDLKKILI